jgi:hypothetical protein
MDASEILSLIVKTKFEDFTKGDWMAFSGCESETPKIGYTEDEATIIIDGDVIEIYIENGDSQEILQFKLSDIN